MSRLVKVQEITQFSFVKKRSDRYNFPTIYASVLNFLLACASHISIISWQKSPSLAFENCRIMKKTVFLHVTPFKAAGKKKKKKKKKNGQTVKPFQRLMPVS